jgi:hypothetical protein
MKILSFLFVVFGISSLIAKEATLPPKPSSEVVIVGGGIVGAFETYHAYMDGVKKGTPSLITVYEAGPAFDLPLSQPQDIPSDKVSLAALQTLYEEADPELKAIFEEAHYAAKESSLNAPLFLPKFYDYMARKMGSYATKGGKLKPCFTLQFNKEVSGLRLSKGANQRILSLQFTDGSLARKGSLKKPCSYIFCPKETVKSLEPLGFDTLAQNEEVSLGELYAKGRLITNARCTRIKQQASELSQPVRDDQKERFESL